MMKISLQTQKVRAQLAIMAGTYANANLAAEQGVLKNLYEANAGVKISSNKNLWIDVGIFASHIGFESAIGKDCWNLTRSMSADNSPYYESGAKILYISNNEKFTITGLILNGWQRIQRVSGNNTPAFGHQLTYKPNTYLTINSSSFVGSETPDSSRQMRYFHDFFSQWQLHPKLGLQVGFDIGAQEKSKGSTGYHTWYTPVLIAKYTLTTKVVLAIRGEYYHDEHGVIVSTSTANGFQTFGYSANLDYILTNQVVWRVECRAFESKDKIFSLEGKPSSSNYFIGTALTISF